MSSVGKSLENEALCNGVLLGGRMLMSIPFVVFGIMKFFHQAHMMAYIERAGIPGQVLYLVAPYQVLCGLALILGYRTRWAAFLLGGFCIVAPLLYHLAWSQPGQLAYFTFNFALAGGFACLWCVGPGRFSIDAKVDSRRAAPMIPFGARSV